MKRATISILFLSWAILGTANASTAYDALRTVQQTRGQSVMNQLIELRGDTGKPQPQSWIVLMNDPAARSGIREFVVSSGDIRSERTPLRRVGSAQPATTLDFSRLNLDSDGAFKLAESQAVRMRVGFNSVNYTLRMNESMGAPEWTLRLVDHMGAPVGSLRVSAVDGKVIQPLQLDPDARVITESARPTRARPPAQDSDPPGERAPMGGVLGAVSRTAGSVAEHTRDVSVRVVGTVEEALTGERTIGRADPSIHPTPTPNP